MADHVVTIGGVQRDLPVFQAANTGAVPLVEFIGDSEFTNAVAQEMLALIPPGTEMLITVVTNALPLTHEISDRSGLPYVCARKKRRTYMREPLIQDVPSMSLGVEETLWLDGPHAARLRGKKVAVVQDVVASGGTASALGRFVELAGGEVSGYIAAFTRGDSRLAVTALQQLPTA